MSTVHIGGRPREFGGALAPFGTATTLPPACYVDADFYEWELERVFRASWLPLCRSDQIPAPGDRYTTVLAGQPVVAVRDTGGAVRVLNNVCRHRATTVADEGRSQGRTLTCPYHHWVYALDGSLVGTPLIGPESRPDVCLPAVRHEEWEGFVLVNLDGQAPRATPELAGLSARLAPWRVAEHEIVASMEFTSHWNWKVMCENWIECYHHLGTHRDTVEPFHAAAGTEVHDNEGAPWSFMTVAGTPETVCAPESRVPGLADADAGVLTIFAAFPFLLGGTVGSHAFWLQVVPETVDRHRLVWHLLVHPALRTQYDDERIASVMEDLATVHREDMVICRRVQEGLESPTAQSGVLAPLDLAIWQFQQWLGAQLADDNTST